MDFYNFLDEIPFKGSKEAYNPYAGKTSKGEWLEGTISIEFLNQHFSQYSTATDMKNATNSEGLKLFFDYLVDKGKLDA